MTAKRLTVSQRAELLVREELDASMRAAGFRRVRLVFQREHGQCFQELRFDTHVYTSGGPSAPTGSLRGWVTIAPLVRSGRNKSGATLSKELRDLVPRGVGFWQVPMTKGPKRKKVGVELRQAGRALVAVLEPIVDAAAVRGLVRRAELSRWQRQLDQIARELKLPSVRRDAAQVQEFIEARTRCLERIAELGP